MADKPTNLRGQPVQVRFWAKVDKSGECWLWTASTGRRGYGKIHVGSRAAPRTISAHRLSLELSGVDIPSGMYVLHSCHTPACVRPDHLRVGDHMENMRDMVDQNRMARGRLNPSAKLTDGDVLKMRDMARAGVSISEICKRFRMSFTAGSNAITGKTWKHLPLIAPPDTMEGE